MKSELGLARSGVLALALVLGGCEGDAENDCSIRDSEQALFGGSTDGGAGTERDAVVALLSDDANARAQELCSGVRIAPALVLTAKHCAAKLGSGRVWFGPSLEDADFSVDIREFLIDEDEDRDLAVAVLADSSRPVPYISPAFDLEPLESSVATLAGYGLDEDGNIGARRFVQEPVVEMDDERLVVDGTGGSGACLGDSGGPLLMTGSRGEYVVGILSVGSASCTKIDVYQRLTPVQGWLQSIMDRFNSSDPDDGHIDPGGC